MTASAEPAAREPVRPRAPRKLRTATGRPGLLEKAAAVTGDAPQTAPAETPGTAVAVLERAPDPTEATLATDFGNDALRAHPGWGYLFSSPVPSGGVPVVVTNASRAEAYDASHAPRTAEAAFWKDIDRDWPLRIERILGPLDAWLGASRKPVPTPPLAAPEQHHEPGAGGDGSWVNAPDTEITRMLHGKADAAPPAPVAAREQHHDESGTGPQAWAPFGELAPEMLAIELGPIEHEPETCGEKHCPDHGHTLGYHEDQNSPLGEHEDREHLECQADGCKYEVWA